MNTFNSSIFLLILCLPPGEDAYVLGEYWWGEWSSQGEYKSFSGHWEMMVTQRSFQTSVLVYVPQGQMWECRACLVGSPTWDQKGNLPVLEMAGPQEASQVSPGDMLWTAEAPLSFSVLTVPPQCLSAVDPHYPMGRKHLHAAGPQPGASEGVGCSQASLSWPWILPSVSPTFSSGKATFSIHKVKTLFPPDMLK